MATTTQSGAVVPAQGGSPELELTAEQKAGQAAQKLEKRTLYILADVLDSHSPSETWFDTEQRKAAAIRIAQENGTEPDFDNLPFTPGQKLATLDEIVALLVDPRLVQSDAVPAVRDAIKAMLDERGIKGVEVDVDVATEADVAAAMNGSSTPEPAPAVTSGSSSSTTSTGSTSTSSS